MKARILLTGLFLMVGYMSAAPGPLLDDEDEYKELLGQPVSFTSSKKITKWGRFNNAYTDCKKFHNFSFELGKDFVSIFVNLFTWDSLKVMIGLFPIFIAARMIDTDVQSAFFCHKVHKNVNQLPSWCHEAVRWGLGIPITIFGLQAIFSPDIEKRITGKIFLLGMPFVIFGKDIIKKFDADCCLRPWHEDHCKDHKRCSGGFPSGHMAEVMYMTVLYGKRFGFAYAVPLGLYAAALGIVFLNCNRHYISQFVAGAALGTMFALAADKVISKRLSEHVSLGISADSNGAPCVKVGCTF